jgi:cytochrome c peroxidase
MKRRSSLTRPLDNYLAGDRKALTSSQQRGLDVFNSGKSKCSTCHAGAEMTDARSASPHRMG